MLLIISLFCIINFISLSCQFVSQSSFTSLNNNKVYALPIDGLHALPNSLRILTASLQARISRRSVYLHNRVTRSIELVFTHIMYMKIP